MTAVNLQKDNLLSLMSYLEDLDTEASVLNKSTSELLEKAKVSGKISKDVFNVLNNTLQSMKKGEVTLNGVVVKPYEKTEQVSTGISFAVPVEEAVAMTSSKTLGGWLNNLEDWDVSHFNINGTEFEATSHNGDSLVYNTDKGILTSGDFSWKLKDDFTHVLHVEEQGIYLFKKNNNKLDGVTWIRWGK